VIHALRESSEFATHLRFFTGVSRPRSVSALGDFQCVHIVTVRPVYDLSFHSVSERRDQSHNGGRTRSVVRGLFGRTAYTVRIQFTVIVLGPAGPNWQRATERPYHGKNDGEHPS
jgi:hypothetical protein